MLSETITENSFARVGEAASRAQWLMNKPDVDHLGSAMRHPWRVIARLLGLCALMIASLVDYGARRWFGPAQPIARLRSDWLRSWSRRYLRQMGIEVDYAGLPPRRGVLVSNHLSYVDILVLAAVQPVVFVAKSEIRGWPIVGWLTRCAGTVFVQRDRRRDVARVIAQLPPIVHERAVVAFFPEGTCTDGRILLPFFPSLLAPAVRNQWPVTPAWISYALDDGIAAQEACYWGEMPFTPHLLNLLSKRRVRARVVFGAPERAGGDRKQLARHLHGRVVALAAGARPKLEAVRP
jgi:1-acyl-sn-glycerol-3-phosphate acyltransferase